MTQKKHSLSVYMLKDDFDPKTHLCNHTEFELHDNPSIPENFIMYLGKSYDYMPWWSDFLKIDSEITIKSSNGAILFVLFSNRWFAFTFGFAYHKLPNEWIEQDFGLLVTLNCVDPAKLKSVNSIDLSNFKRRVVQPSTPSELTFFDFDIDSNIVNNLTGQVKDEYKSWFTQITGSQSLKISTKIEMLELADLCKNLYGRYKSQDYKQVFPNINNVKPIKDKRFITELDNKLLDALKNCSETLSLNIPEIIDYTEITKYSFSQKGTKLINDKHIFEDVQIDNYYKYLTDNSTKREETNLVKLKEHQLVLLDENHKVKKQYNIYKCLSLESLTSNQDSNYLLNGKWYKIAKDYLYTLRDRLDKYYENDSILPDYSHGSEAEYNISVFSHSPNLLCLDKKLCSIKGQGPSKFEFCDLYEASGEQNIFYHIKHGVNSAKLSHLFQQGLTSIDLIKNDNNSKDTLTNLIIETRQEKNGIQANDAISVNAFLRNGKYKVIYGIINPKDASKKSKNLPIFSCISLKNAIDRLKMQNVEVAFCFIKNAKNVYS